ncbi:MAG: YigZ family protein [Lachnospiraceae bacterium]|nr:YigZ family protein [Lachnospiraceae bacterium]
MIISMEKYLTVKENSIYTGGITEKKSRFIAYLSHAASAEEAMSFLSSIRKKHYDAKHNCSAYIIAGEDGAPDTLHSSDDGEPSGTAGKPIMSVLSGAGLKNVVLVVTRYFGGILLGTGGLVRAYTDASKEALKAAEKEIIRVTDLKDLSFIFDYRNEGKVRRILEEYGLIPVNTEYGERVCFLVSAESEVAELLTDSLTEKLSGEVEFRFN